jgi:hypothetical protein
MPTNIEWWNKRTYICSTVHSYDEGKTRTYCGALIPPVAQHLPLGSDIRCRKCERIAAKRVNQ